MLRRLTTIALTLPLVLGLAACGSSGWGKARDAGIPIGYGDYQDMCDVRAGEFKPGMKVERTWTSEQDSKLRSILSADPRCQPEN